jgi:hypothetical protein
LDEVHGYEATLRITNPLSFRTNEYGNVVRTSRILHNFALRFALNRIRGDPALDHLQNLDGAPIYATPGVPIQAEFEFQTFHPFPEAPLLFRNPGNYRPGSLKTLQGTLTILHHKEVVRPGSTFRFSVASREPLPKEMVITYGGKATLQHVSLEEGRISSQTLFEGTVEDPMNPLDFEPPVRFTHCQTFSVPPSPLFTGRLSKPVKCRILKVGPRQYIIPVTW